MGFKMNFIIIKMNYKYSISVNKSQFPNILTSNNHKIFFLQNNMKQHHFGRK